ncbi:hypothetical protein [Myxosarcina sp. GI1]|uniref:hypothetical protein n=1 Tax=Myxosarcina sp. GI1 TaxID=1541065 RepID=UPI00155A74EB|nr:hypothetical protein [Myxosarcina sp. GI1]
MFYITFILLLIGNWLLSSFLVFIPSGIIDRLNNLSWWGMTFIGLVFLAWCLGDE